MVAFIFFLAGLLCGLISRALLIKAAFGISKKWGFGVFFPFGPLFFRLSFPEEVGRARLFQLATLPCFFLYVLLSPQLIPSMRFGLNRVGPPGQEKYALVAGDHVFKLGGYASEPAPQKPPSLTELCAANARELDRLHLLGEQMRLRKRDLLNSDEAGALAYNRDATEYNAALAKAHAEQSALAATE